MRYQIDAEWDKIIGQGIDINAIKGREKIVNNLERNYKKGQS